MTAAWLLRAPQVAQPPARRATPGSHAEPRSGLTVDDLGPLVALAPLAGLVPADHYWAAQFLLVLLLLTVPGVILLRALRVPGQAIASFPLYIPCASLVVLLGSGFAVDLIGPIAGVAAPLRPWPMLTGLGLTCLLLTAASVGAPPILTRGLVRPGRTALPLLLPLLAAAGALRLNSDHGSTVAVAALGACVLVTVAVLVGADKLGTPVLAVALYATGLAMEWSFSLRGASVYGFDISDEYYILQHTVAAGVWHPAHPGDPFSAMLSTTVLPAELHALSGVPALLVLKVISPAISALFPVAVFFLARRILSARWAFTAGALIVAQSAFGQELPAIARQEIALVLFAALVAAMLDGTLRRRVQCPLVLAFAVALVVSHYSTTYVTITLLGLAVVLQWAASWFRPVPRGSWGVATALLAATIGAAIWYGPVTHSYGNVSHLVAAAQSQGADFLPNRSGEGLLAAYLDGNTVTPISAAQYARLVQADYAQNKSYVSPIKDAGSPAYALRDSVTPAPPVKWPLAYTAFGDGQVLAQQLIYLLGAAGALFLIFRRSSPVIARQIALLTFATLLFLAAIRVSGTLATFYNAQRALLQAMTFLAIPVAWCLQAAAGQRKLRRACAVAAAAALVAVIFATGNGLVGALVGGGTATNLASTGEDYEQFYVTPQELAAAAWLGTQAAPGQLVYADEYGQLPLESVIGLRSGLELDITPQTLSSQAWVYASSTNVVDGRARASYDGH
ncbi:MAG TPA: hypothetical protein VIX15_18035, partial [Streptosporangiaceae bacterium]